MDKFHLMVEMRRYYAHAYHRYERGELRPVVDVDPKRARVEEGGVGPSKQPVA